MKSHRHHNLHLLHLKPSHPHRPKQKKSTKKINVSELAATTYRSSMVSRDNDNDSNNNRSILQLHEKLQLLRSTTHSHAVNEGSILADASKYIQELKEKVDILNRDITTTSHSDSNAKPLDVEVRVETLEKGFLIKIKAEKNCPSLLVSVLEAFEHLNLDVSEVTASCSNNFRFQAIGSTNYYGEEQGRENVNAQVVREAVLQAIAHSNQHR